VKCNGDMAADDFAQFFINKINISYELRRKKEDFLFKAYGSSEYMYGPHKLINFEHIRKCLTKGLKIELCLIEKKTIIEELGGISNTPKEISYDLSNFKQQLQKHENVKLESKQWNDMECISMWDLNRPFRIRIIGADNITKNDNPVYEEYQQKLTYEPTQTVVFAKLDLFHGANKVARTRFTRAVPFSRYARWNQYVVFPDILISELSRETKVCITVYSKKYKKKDPMLHSTNGDGYLREKDIPLSYVNYPLIDHKGEFKTGGMKLRMWPDEASQPQFATVQNVGSGGLADDCAPCEFTYEIDCFCLPVLFPNGEPPVVMQAKYRTFEKELNDLYPRLPEEAQGKELDRILSTDPLYQLNEEEMWRIWDSRNILKKNRKALPKVLASVPAQHPQAVFLSHQILSEWETIDPLDAIELLDYNFADGFVRQYAVQMLNKLDDNELSDFILQLVQTLKYELYHDSALSRFLLQRGLRSPHVIGHVLFCRWNITIINN
jgi:phosphatidylinositol-4,5-bisphosphate 3-kinase